MSNGIKMKKAEFGIDKARRGEKAPVSFLPQQGSRDWIAARSPATSGSGVKMKTDRIQPKETPPPKAPAKAAPQPYAFEQTGKPKGTAPYVAVNQAYTGLIPSASPAVEKGETEPKKTYQRDRTRGKKPGIYAPLPTPAGRDEKEELRMETRQQTQLSKGILPEELGRRAEVNEGRTYRPTSQDLERQYDVFEEELAEIDQLLGKLSEGDCQAGGSGGQRGAVHRDRQHSL